MSVLYIALPVALLLAVVAVVAFVYQARSGQFDDLETPPRRILFDDCEGVSGQSAAADVSDGNEISKPQNTANDASVRSRTPYD